MTWQVSYTEICIQGVNLVGRSTMIGVNVDVKMGVIGGIQGHTVNR